MTLRFIAFPASMSWKPGTTAGGVLPSDSELGMARLRHKLLQRKGNCMDAE
jgi:hypothetical protein